MMNSIAAASMSMSQMEFDNAYDLALMKKSMNMQEQEAAALIEMMESVPTGGDLTQYGFDVYG